MKLRLFALFVAIVFTNTSIHSANALDFVQTNVQPVYQFEIFPSSGFITESENVTLDFEALGDVEISIDDADLLAFAENPSLPIPLSAASGSFLGQMPVGTIVPEGTPFRLDALELVSGQLANVAADAGGNITAADATFTLLFVHRVAPDTPAEVNLFGAEMTFTGAIDAVPFSVGTSFTSPEPAGLFLGSLSGDQVGLVKNRFLNVVPEPNGFGSLLLGTLVCLRCRRKSQSPSTVRNN